MALLAWWLFWWLLGFPVAVGGCASLWWLFLLTCATIPSVATATRKREANGKTERGREGPGHLRTSSRVGGVVDRLLRGWSPAPGEGGPSSGDAIKLYQIRKADARRGLKMPELVPGKVVTFGHLSAMAVEHATTHLKSTDDYYQRPHSA